MINFQFPRYVDLPISKGHFEIKCSLNMLCKICVFKLIVLGEQMPDCDKMPIPCPVMVPSNIDCVCPQICHIHVDSLSRVDDLDYRKFILDIWHSSLSKK